MSIQSNREREGLFSRLAHKVLRPVSKVTAKLITKNNIHMVADAEEAARRINDGNYDVVLVLDINGNVAPAAIGDRKMRQIVTRSSSRHSASFDMWQMVAEVFYDGTRPVKVETRDITGLFLSPDDYEAFLAHSKESVVASRKVVQLLFSYFAYVHLILKRRHLPTMPDGLWTMAMADKQVPPELTKPLKDIYHQDPEFRDLLMGVLKKRGYKDFLDFLAGNAADRKKIKPWKQLLAEAKADRQALVFTGSPLMPAFMQLILADELHNAVRYSVAPFSTASISFKVAVILADFDNISGKLIDPELYKRDLGVYGNVDVFAIPSQAQKADEAAEAQEEDRKAA